MPTLDSCPCGRRDAQGVPRTFEDCCGRWQHAPAPDAESLMRSRYSAFVRADVAYLLATWHPSTRPISLELEPGTRWLGLEVKGHWPAGDDRAEVEFVARSRPAAGGPALRLHERSRFIREGGRWFYVDGVMS